MKINKIYQDSISGVKAYFIEYEGGGVFVQRTAPSSASDNPLSSTEEIICALASACEERDRYNWILKYMADRGLMSETSYHLAEDAFENKRLEGK